MCLNTDEVTIKDRGVTNKDRDGPVYFNRLKDLFSVNERFFSFIYNLISLLFSYNWYPLIHLIFLEHWNSKNFLIPVIKF